MRDQINKYRNIILLIIGTLLVILSLCLLFYDRFSMLKTNVFDEIDMEKYRENGENVEEDDSEDTSTIDIETDSIIDDEEDEEDDEGNGGSGSKSKVTNETREKIKKEFIGYLEIKKINLKLGFLSKKSYYNSVKYHIQTLATSDYPDKNLGNVIIAGHSGTGYRAFFKNLYKLKKGDEANIYYKGYIYTYKIVNIYNVPKVGKIKIVRDVYKNCLTLITCTKDSKTEQTVYILELASKVKEGGNS